MYSVARTKQKQRGCKKRSSIVKGYIISDQILLFLHNGASLDEGIRQQCDEQT